MKRVSLWLPFSIFVVFFGVVAFGLIRPSDHVITSKMVGKPLPQFALQPAHEGQAGLTSGDFSGGAPRLLNVFASWCIPCIAEAPHLMQLQSKGIEINAIAIRDRPEDVARFLERNGNPYTRIGSDTVGKVQISLGSSGVPETFVIDGKGIIRHQHIGDIRADDIPEIMQALEAAK
ncbi:MAG: DsbE family thiol:disulfide interchange protein [Sphingomonadales bacterium]|nr:DsbE family thiol:disulfide interchange protein [Sphingomonadales bacterium]MBK9999949.1 DsbE family thiol:disulfide interchange protein [Sphingomonadales bacterium]